MGYYLLWYDSYEKIFIVWYLLWYIYSMRFIAWYSLFNVYCLMRDVSERWISKYNIFENYILWVFISGYDIADAWSVSIGDKSYGFAINIDKNITIKWSRIIIVGCQVKCQIKRIHSRIVKGCYEALQTRYALFLFNCSHTVQKGCNYADCHYREVPSHEKQLCILRGI